MKNVLITGGAGFIAHHIIAHIIKHTDWNITTIDRLDISGNLNRLHDILNDFSVDEKKKLKQFFEKKNRSENEFNQVLILIKKYNIINECYRKAEHFINLASNSLSIFNETKEKEILKNLTSFSLQRSF